MRDQIKQLQADNGTLQAKLKEALAVQPAAVDPREMARIQEQLRSLIKENDLLKVSLAQGHGGTPVGVDAKSFEELQQALAGMNQKLADQTARADKLALENQAFQTRMQSLLASADASGALREENELLKKEVAALKSTPPASLESGDANSELAKARAQIAGLQSDAEVNSLEKMALENRIKRLQGRSRVGPADENEARIRELERERDDLLAKLGEANKKLNERKGKNAAAQIETLAQQVDTLRARLAVDEAQAIPYTPEELALFRQSAPRIARKSCCRGINPFANCPMARLRWWQRRRIIFPRNNTTRRRMIIRKFYGTTKTTRWRWPILPSLSWNKTNSTTRKSTSNRRSRKVRTTLTT